MVIRFNVTVPNYNISVLSMPHCIIKLSLYIVVFLLRKAYIVMRRCKVQQFRFCVILPLKMIKMI